MLLNIYSFTILNVVCKSVCCLLTNFTRTSKTLGEKSEKMNLVESCFHFSWNVIENRCDVLPFFVRYITLLVLWLVSLAHWYRVIFVNESTKWSKWKHANNLKTKTNKKTQTKTEILLHTELVHLSAGPGSWIISPPENDSFRKDLCFSPDVF